MGGVLKRRVLSGASGCVNFGITSSEESTFVKNINGKTLGKTLKAQAEIPSRDFDIYLAGLVIMQIKNQKTRMLVPT